MVAVTQVLAMLLLVVGTVGIALKFPRKPTRAQLLVALFGGLVAATAITTLTLHACQLGNPIAQVVLPAACVSASLMFVSSAPVRWTWAAGALTIGVALSFDYIAEVHGIDYVGSDQIEPHYGTGPIQAEWHTWLTGLYRTPHRARAGHP